MFANDLLTLLPAQEGLGVFNALQLPHTHLQQLLSLAALTSCNSWVAVAHHRVEHRFSHSRAKCLNAQNY